MTTKRFRILLVNDPLPALFMAAWYRQNNFSQDRETETLGIYVGPEVFDRNSDRSDFNRSLHLEATQQALEIDGISWAIMFAKRYIQDFRGFNPFQLLQERKLRFQELKQIKNILREHQVDPEAVVEIWSRDTGVDRHFLSLCPNAKAIFFEHGLSDIKNHLSEHKNSNPPKTIRHRLRSRRQKFQKLVNEFFLYFKIEPLSDAKKISLMAEEIERANPRVQNMMSLDPKAVINATQNIEETEAGLLKKISGPSAIILLAFPYPKPWQPKAREDLLKLFASFEDLLLEKYDRLFEQMGIETLVFKSKFYYEEYAKEGIEAFTRLKAKYKFIYISDYSPKNFPTEFYLKGIHPKLILSSYSSAAFFSKKLFPEIRSFTYDEWLVRFTRSNFNYAFPEFDWYRPIFNQEYRTIFEKFIPEDL